MTKVDLEPLDDEVAALLDHERHHDVVPPGAESRAWDRLSHVLGAGTAPRFGGPGPSSASLWKWVGVYALGILTGVAATHLVARRAPDPRPPPSPAPSIPTREVAVPTPRPVPSVAEPPAPPEPPALASATSRTANSASPGRASLEEELALLDAARRGLAEGDGKRALDAAQRHAQRFPEGSLAEEREAIAIQALLLLTQYGDARDREGRFERKFPHSTLLQAVRASVQSIP